MSQYRHVVEYVRPVQTLDSVSRNCCGLLVGKCFFNILRYFFSYEKAGKSLGFGFDDPCVLLFQNEPYSIDCLKTKLIQLISTSLR